MSGAERPSVLPLGEADLEDAGAFLRAHLNPDVPLEAWLALLRPPWRTLPTRGFQLRADGQLVGVYAMVYAYRGQGAQERVVCNLAAFCVREEHRPHSLRLLRAALAQRDMLLTDLSPSGNVPAINQRLGFSSLDTATRLVLNVHAPRRGAAVTDDHDRIAALLTGEDALVFRDHRAAPAARHLVVADDSGYAYLMYRRDTRKRVRSFASPLFVGGDAGLLEAEWAGVSAHLRRHGLLATLAERRVLGFTPRGIGWELAHPRPKMFKGADVETDQVDYLYSELALLEW